MTITSRKTCLILGSNSDVGQACAYEFAKNGFDIQLATRTVDDYQKKLATDLKIRHEVETTNHYFDASLFEEHNDFYKKLPHKPTVVIAIFGYLGNHEKALVDFQETNTILTANFIGKVSILNIIANDMEERQEGTIVGISSVAGERGRKSNYIYGASKAGFTTYLSGLRNRLSSSNVHVATVIPGFINTKMIKGLETPAPLTAQPEQVAKAIWKTFNKKKNITYSLPIWQLIMFVIKSIPEFLFKKMNL